MENENQNYKIPLPTDADLPHLKTKSELDQEFLEQFELNPEVIDEPIQYTFEIDGIGFSPLGDIQALKGAQKKRQIILSLSADGCRPERRIPWCSMSIREPKNSLCRH